MCRKGVSVSVLACCLLLIGVLTAYAGTVVNQKAVLSGQVVMVVPVGTVVQEGTELVRVATLAGSATAARANQQGVVTEILVGVGSEIKSGDVVVKVEAQP